MQGQTGRRVGREPGLHVQCRLRRHATRACWWWTRSARGRWRASLLDVIRRVTDKPIELRRRHPLPRRPLLRPAGVQGRRRQDLGARARPGRACAPTALQQRLKQRREALGAVDRRGLPHRPGRRLAGRRHATSRFGGLHFVLRHVGPAHSAGGHGAAGGRRTACCSPATWCSRAACPSSARPTAGRGSARWTS
ncbi:MAG: hypothetical protein MZW92_60630 [Comamonadaceae bacterium]|nr:hypothetical protein [Comamonadaceae bacterium]